MGLGNPFLRYPRATPVSCGRKKIGSYKMYEIISANQATTKEREFLEFVVLRSRELASYQIVVNHKNEINLSHLTAPFDGVSLCGLRPDFLNTQMELAGIVADLNHRDASPYETLCREYESALYGVALVEFEAAHKGA